MVPQLATLIFILGILGLFALDRIKGVRTSKVLWIAVIWLAIAGSRNLGEWLNLGSPSDQNEAYLEGNPVDRNSLAAFEAIALITLVRRQRRVADIIRANPFVLLYFGYALLSVVWADYPFVSMKRWIRASGDLIMVLAVVSDPNCLAAIKRLLARVGFILLPISILFVRYFPDLGRAYGSSDGTMYWTGVSTGKNGLGVICQVFGVATVWRLCLAWRDREDPKRKKRLFAHATILLMAVYLLYEANSMTSIMCFAMASSIIVAVNFFPLMRKPGPLHCVVAIAVGCSFSVLFLHVGGSALHALGRDPSLTGRTDVWQMVLPFAENPVIGTGYESFWIGERLLKIHQMNPGINQAHNGYIEVFLNLGMLGVIFVVTLILTGYSRVIAGLRRNYEIGSLRLGFFLIFVIYNFTEAGVKMMHPIWICFLLAVTLTPKAIELHKRKQYELVSAWHSVAV